LEAGVLTVNELPEHLASTIFSCFEDPSKLPPSRSSSSIELLEIHGARLLITVIPAGAELAA
jgi:hypothetical protein